MAEFTNNVFQINGTVLEKYLGGKAETVTVPQEITEIRSYAFRDADISYVRLPSALKRIGMGAFRNSRLKAVTIPDNVIIIDNWAFDRCVALEEVTLGSGLYSLGIGAFTNCALKSIAIPQGVKEIAAETFMYCEKLETVVLPDSLERIAMRAFYHCKSLKNLVLPQNLKRIKEFAFADTYLKGINIPASVEIIGAGAFSTCSARGITVEEGGLFHKDGGCLINTADKRLIAGDALSVIPEDGSVTSIASFAFNGYNCKDKIITVPLAIETIESNAFCNCEHLVIHCKIDAKPEAWHTQWYEHDEWWDKDEDDEDEPNSYEITVVWDCTKGEERERYERAKAICEAAEEAEREKIRKERLKRIAELEKDGFKIFIQTDDDNQPVIPLEGKYTIEKYVGTAKEVTVPSDVRKIAKSAFADNETIVKVNLGEVEELRDCAFENCKNLESVVFSDKITSLRPGVFANCTKLRLDDLPDTIKMVEQLALSNTAVQKVKPNAVNLVGNYAYCGCQSLQEVEIRSDGYYVVRWGAFKNCKNLKKAIFDFKRKEIEWDTFNGCSSLKTVQLPAGLCKIGNGAFKDCESLEEISLPDTMLKIEQSAFENCKSLTELIIPKSVTEIGDNAFAGCTGLKKVVLFKMLAMQVKRIFGEAVDLSIFRFV